MEYLNFGGGSSDYEFGKELAKMHVAKPADETAASGKFGFSVNNTCGGNKQINTWEGNWVDFYRKHRLEYQLRLAGDANLNKYGKVLCDNLDFFFKGIDVKPSILHGDLWSGNISSVEGQPSIFDPAVYYGHHEAEFGMSWCASFGGNFWKGYREIIPEDPGFRDRVSLYKLYHYLNHYNLFGGGYYGSCTSILSNLTSKVK